MRTTATAIRPVESHSGAQETIIAELYHNLIPYAPRGNVGRGVPSPSDYLGELMQI